MASPDYRALWGPCQEVVTKMLRCCYGIGRKNVTNFKGLFSGIFVPLFPPAFAALISSFLLLYNSFLAL